MQEMINQHALSYYNNTSQEIRNLYHKLFISIDTNHDGRVDFKNIKKFLKGKPLFARYIKRSVFKQLDQNKDGSLDFLEFITLFYTVFMNFHCNKCRRPLRGQVHLTCAKCFTSGKKAGDSFDLCWACYCSGTYKHRHDMQVDYYELMLTNSYTHVFKKINTKGRRKKLEATSYVQTADSVTPPIYIVRKHHGGTDPLEALLSALQTATNISTIGAAIAASSGCCTIM